MKRGGNPSDISLARFLFFIHQKKSNENECKPLIDENLKKAGEEN
jgi:hypothetical protein